MTEVLYKQGLATLWFKIIEYFNTNYKKKQL